jgi:hypothetical protein
MKWYMWLVLLMGLGCLYLGIQELRLAQHVESTPQQMTLAQLIEKGPGENHHVLVSDLRFGHNFVFEEKSTRNSTGKVWIPVAPAAGQAKPGADEEEPADIKPSDIRALIKSTRVFNDAEMARLTSQNKIQGVVINLIESLSSSEQQLLEQAYPGAEFTKCLIIEEGRHEDMTSKIWFGLVAGIILTGLGVLPLLLRMRRKASGA